MVAAISTTINSKRATTPRRPPLLPSESDNALAPPRRPKAREVTSRYMSSSSSSSSSFSSPPRRCNSPLVTRTVNSTRQKSTPAVTPTPFVKRSQSVERRRQGTPRPNGDAPVAQKMLFTSTRSLSVSFQGESFPIQVSKVKPIPPTPQSVRKSTPERRKAATTPTTARGRVNGNSDQTENSRLVDQHRWPGKLQQNQQVHTNFMNRSLDCGVLSRNSNGPGSNVVRSLRNSIDARASHDATLRSGSTKNSGSEFKPEPEADDSVPSDNESVTSSNSSGGQAQRASRTIVVPARYWQEANNRLRRQTDSPSSMNGGIGNKATVPPKLLAPKKSVLDSPLSSPRGVVNSRLQGSPIRSAVRPASPSKLATPSPWSPSRGVSPSRARNGVVGSLSSRFGNEPSVLSFAVDVPRGKIGENKIVDAHLVRLLHNRLMQWRFVNARQDSSLSAQTLIAEVYFIEFLYLNFVPYSCLCITP